MSYDYYRSLPSLDGADCAICMAAVGPGGVRGEADGDRVTTPCDHAFHLACFKVSIPAFFLELLAIALVLALAFCVFHVWGPSSSKFPFFFMQQTFDLWTWAMRAMLTSFLRIVDSLY